MSEFCEHETFKDVCGICHRDGVITRLRAENERLRAALKEILNLPYGSEGYCRVIARAALAAQPAPGKEEV